MVFSTGTTTVTLTAVIPPVLLSDLGIAAGSNTVGTVLQLPYRDAQALVQGGYASFGSPAKTQDNYDDESGRVDLFLPAAGGPIGASATITGDPVETRSAGHVRLLAAATVAASAAIEQSLDGQTWFRPVAATAIAAGASVILEQPAAGRYVRGVIINGAAAGTAYGQLSIDA